LKALYFAYILTILTLSLIPMHDMNINNNDKFNHFIAFFVFTILGFLAYRFKYISLFFIGLLVGIAIEVFQYFVKYRSTEFADLVADSIGILLALIVIFLFNRLIKSSKEVLLFNINLNKMKEEHFGKKTSY